VLALWTIVVPTTSLFDVAGLSVAPYMVFEGLAFLGWMVRGPLNHRRVAVPVGLAFLGVHVGFSAASLLVVEDFRIAITSFLRMGLLWLLMFLLVGLIVRRSQFVRLRTALLVQAVVVLFIGGASSFELGPGYSLFATQFQKNEYATYMALVSMLSMSVLVSGTESFHDRLLALVTLALVAVGWPLTYSRSGLVAIVVALVAFAYFNLTVKFVRLLAVVVVLVGVAFASLPEGARSTATQAIKSMTGAETDNAVFRQTIDERLTLNRVALERIVASPLLGVGFNQFTLHSPVIITIWDVKHQSLADVGSTVHNRYLHMAAESGVPALIGYLGFASVLLIAALRLRRDADRQLRQMLDAMIAAELGFLASLLFSPGLPWEWPLLGLLAATVNIVRRERRERGDRQRHLEHASAMLPDTRWPAVPFQPSIHAE